MREPRVCVKIEETTDCMAWVLNFIRTTKVKDGSDSDGKSYKSLGIRFSWYEEAFANCVLND